MNKNHPSKLRFIQKISYIIILLSALLHSYNAMAQALQTPEKILQKMLPSEKASRAMLAAIDSADYSLEDYLLEVSLLSSDEIIADLKQRLATQIYAGSLLGAEGALLSHAGNAWDQAFLLQQALQASGAETRLVYTLLSENNRNAYLNSAEKAKFKLNKRSRNALEQALPAFMGDAKSVQQMNEVFNNGYPRNDIPKQFNAIADNIRAAAGDHFPDGSSLLARLHKEITPYIWVQYRAKNHSPWQDAHIAFTPVEKISDQKLFSEINQNSNYKHRINISVSLEILNENGSFSEEKLIENKDFYTDERFRTPFDLIIAGSSRIKGNEKNTLNDNIFYTLHGDSMDVNGNLFTPSGTIISPWTVKNDPYGMADLFATTGGAMEKFGSFLGDELTTSTSNQKNKKHDKKATGVILKVKYVPPFDSKREFSQTRYLVDRLGEQARAAKDYSKLKPAFVFNGHWTLYSLLTEASPSELLYKFSHRTNEFYSGKLKTNQNDFASAYLANLYLRPPYKNSNTLFWRGEPMIMLASEKIIENKEGKTASQIGIDIMHSGLRAARIENDQFTPDTQAALIAGVYETFMESYSAETNSLLIGGKRNAKTAWKLLENKNYKLITSNDISNKKLSKWVVKNINQEFKSNNIVAAAAEHNAWWRIDADSGVVTGIDEYGRGQALTEQITILVEGVWTIVNTTISYDGCASLASFEMQKCCALSNGAMTMVSLAAPAIMPSSALWQSATNLVNLQLDTIGLVSYYYKGLEINTNPIDAAYCQ